jgi:hypothetical protein
MSFLRKKLLQHVLDKIDSRDQVDAANLRDAKRKMQQTAPVKKVSDRALSYVHRHRGQWHAGEYDFDEIQIAQDTDSYMFRAIQKKVNRVVTAGFEFVGEEEEPVDYVQNRLRQIAHATQRPLELLIYDTFADLFRYSNCMWVKVRDNKKSAGQVRRSITGKELEPVAGYFILPFETLQFKNKRNGEIKKVMQKLPGGDTKEFAPTDIIHFYTNRKPGFGVGTPELLPALDDIALLRRIEENVEDLIETNLFPLFHYKVGSDQYPERYTPDGTKETDIVKQTISYMPAGAIYVSDHRHEIEAIGSEGRALRLDFYINYFKNRALSALGVSPVDMGEGAGANRSTASTMSKALMVDVEAMTVIFKHFFEFYIIEELLLEGGFDPLEQSNRVRIKFGVIDKEERRADENQQIQLFDNNLQTIDEVRQALGSRPWTPEHTERSHYKMYQEPLALLTGLGPGTAAGEVLAQHESSNIEPAAIAKEKTFAEKQVKAQAKTQQNGSQTKSNGTSANKAKPANQHGTRSSTKTNRDLCVLDIETPTGDVCIITCDSEVSPATIDEWRELVYQRYNELKDLGVDFVTLANSLSWRLLGIEND